ncbi:MAG: FecR family protein [Gammaproteobacteria bacterium]|nr:FecR family protein [Gammaproteobacteria bacterium]
MSYRPTGILLLLLSTLLLLASASAWSKPVGEAVFVLGKVRVIDKNGTIKKVRRGDNIENEVTITTGKRGQIQIRLLDNSIINIRPESEFKIQNFKQSSNATNEQAFYELAKGGFRAVTGTVGKKNKKSYRVKTPTGTLGIRGTDYNMTFCDQACSDKGGQAGLYLGVVSGSVELKNKGGSKIIGARQLAHTKSEDSRAINIKNVPTSIDFTRPRKDKSGKTRFLQIDEEIVVDAATQNPKSAKTILKKAAQANFNAKDIVNAAEELGLKPESAIVPILSGGADPRAVVRMYVEAYPEKGQDIVIAAMSRGAPSQIDDIRQGAKDGGLKTRDIDVAESIKNMTTLPEYLKEPPPAEEESSNQQQSADEENKVESEKQSIDAPDEAETSGEDKAPEEDKRDDDEIPLDDDVGDRGGDEEGGRQDEGDEPPLEDTPPDEDAGEPLSPA